MDMSLELLTHAQCQVFAKRIAAMLVAEKRPYDHTSYSVCCWLLGTCGNDKVYVRPDGKLLRLKQSWLWWRRPRYDSFTPFNLLTETVSTPSST